MCRLSSSAPPIWSNGWDGDRLYQQAPGGKKAQMCERNEERKAADRQNRDRKTTWGLFDGILPSVFATWSQNAALGLESNCLAGWVGGWKALCHSKLMTEILIRSNNVSPWRRGKMLSLSKLHSTAALGECKTSFNSTAEAANEWKHMKGFKSLFQVNGL